jgi:hypothetical protein
MNKTDVFAHDIKEYRVYIHTCMYSCIFIHVCIRVHSYMRALHAHATIRVYSYMYVFVYIHTCMHYTRMLLSRTICMSSMHTHIQ